MTCSIPETEPIQVHIHNDHTMPCQVLRPVFDHNDWQNLQERLTRILQYYEEVPAIGTSFLVERIDKHHQLGDINVTIHHDYILVRTYYGWEQHLSIWSNQPSYVYEFDIFQLRPVERLRG